MMTSPREKTGFEWDSLPYFALPVEVSRATTYGIRGSAIVDTTDQSADQSASKFCTLPVELRLQIYGYVLRGSRIRHTHVAPHTTYDSHCVKPTAADFCLRMLRPNGISSPRWTSAGFGLRTERTLFMNGKIACREEKLGQKRRVQGKISFGLLGSCTMIYEEARALPWEINEWAFINWFGSGLYAAREFSRGLREWQRGVMRHVSLDVQVRDLVVGHGEWKDLCRFWSGVRILRLCVKGNSYSFDARDGDEHHVKTGSRHDMLDVGATWVRSGLLEMESLRRLEIEVEEDSVGREEKVLFCNDLQRALDAKLIHEVKLILVERLMEHEEVKEQDNDIVPVRTFWKGWLG